MNTNYTGIYWLLGDFGIDPVWIFPTVAVLFFLVPILIIRRIQEGQPYNVSFAANTGDLFLCILPVICSVVLQSKSPLLPAWLQNDHFQPFVGSCAIIVGWGWFLLDTPKYLADAYHHIVILPTLAYCVITSIPVIWIAGTYIQVIGMCVMLAIFVATFLWDIIDGCLAQRPWIKKHQFKF